MDQLESQHALGNPPTTYCATKTINNKVPIAQPAKSIWAVTYYAMRGFGPFVELNSTGGKIMAPALGNITKE